MNCIATILLLVGSVATIHAQQESCGCASAAPINIQLTCGNNNVPPPPPPPQPECQPAPAPAPETCPFELPSEEKMMEMCEMDQHGNFIAHPPGGFPEGFKFEFDEFGNPNPQMPDDFPMFDENWDGNFESLDLCPGTPNYNLMVCLMMPIPVMAG